MFERFDDPEPYAPPAALQVKVTATGRRRRRRRRAIVSGSAAVAVLALAAAPVVYLRQQANQLEHVEVAGLAPVTPRTAPPTTAPVGGGGVTTPDTAPPALAAPINLLVVGVDTRPDGDAVTGSRTDTIAVVRLDPDGPRLTVLSIPRDLYVPIEGGGTDRINSALARGRDALVATVGDTLGIEINHYMEIDFAGFSRLVDLAGGVDIAFDAPVRDRNTGFVADAGCAHLDGQAALAYVRARHFETYDAAGDRWVRDPTSDLGRIARQQAFGVRAIDQVLGSSYSTVDQLRILTDVLDDVTVDEGLSLDGLRAIWNTAAAAGTDRTTLLTLNDVVRGTTVDGASVLVADPDTVREVAAPLRGEVAGEAAAAATTTTTEPATRPASTPATTEPAPPDGDDQVSGGCPAG
jgi:LCP family protein required for cell wall assembly